VAKPIQITLADGTVKSGTAGTTTPMDIAKQIASSLAEAAMIAKVSNVSLQRPHWRVGRLPAHIRAVLFEPCAP
jgi:hypothetical protein